MKIRLNWTCPLELVHDMISGKWKPIILWRLRLKNASLSELEKDIKGINQKMLLEHLKELIEFGFVSKKSFNGYPLKVEYSLTKDKGKKILRALKIMQEVGIDFMIEYGHEKTLIEKSVLTEEECEEKKRSLLPK